MHAVAERACERNRPRIDDARVTFTDPGADGGATRSISLSSPASIEMTRTSRMQGLAFVWCRFNLPAPVRTPYRGIQARSGAGLQVMVSTGPPGRRGML